LRGLLTSVAGWVCSRWPFRIRWSWRSWTTASGGWTARTYARRVWRTCFSTCAGRPRWVWCLFGPEAERLLDGNGWLWTRSSLRRCRMTVSNVWVYAWEWGLRLSLGLGAYIFFGRRSELLEAIHVLDLLLDLVDRGNARARNALYTPQSRVCRWHVVESQR